MEAIAIVRAKRRLVRAEQATQQLLKTEDFEEIRSAWSDYLQAVAGIYEMLRIGSRASGASEAWYGRIKKERKEDPLLRYLHHARNSDFHGLKEITNTNGMWRLQEMPDGTFAGTYVISEQGFEPSDFRVGVINSDGSETVVTTPIIEKPFVTLAPVYDDKHGHMCDIPNGQLGEELTFLGPNVAAATSLHYIRDLVAVAEALIEP